jgi:protein CpxP
MTRFALCILFALSLSTLVKAQTPDPYTPNQQPRGPKDSATKRAARQLKMMEKQLHLNEDQVLQLQIILINRDIAMDSVQHNPSGDRRTDGQTRRSIQQDADQKINALLTDDQKPLYQQWKEQQKRRMQQRRQANEAVNNSNPQ